MAPGRGRGHLCWWPLIYAGSGKNEYFEMTLINCNKAEMTLKGNSECGIEYILFYINWLEG
jgi:hypothetical protein